MYIDYQAWCQLHNDGRDIPLGGALGNGPDIDRRAAERAEEAAGTAGHPRHPVADHGQNRAGWSHLDTLNLSLSQLECESALDHLKARRSKRWKKTGQAERNPFSRDELLWRVAFLTADRIMDVNLAHLVFRTPADIDALYDFVEEQVAGTGRRWFILENFDGTRVEPPARPRHAARDAALRDSWSLGSVAYAPGGRDRDASAFCDTREDALAAIAAIKADAVQG